MEYLQRRGMDGVAAKVAKEVGVLLQHSNIHAGPSKQEAQHPARGSSADNAPLGFNLVYLRSLFIHDKSPGEILFGVASTCCSPFSFASKNCTYRRSSIALRASAKSR